MNQDPMHRSPEAARLRIGRFDEGGPWPFGRPHHLAGRLRGVSGEIALVPEWVRKDASADDALFHLPYECAANWPAAAATAEVLLSVMHDLSGWPRVSDLGAVFVEVLSLYSSTPTAHSLEVLERQWATFMDATWVPESPADGGLK